MAAILGIRSATVGKHPEHWRACREEPMARSEERTSRTVIAASFIRRKICGCSLRQTDPEACGYLLHPIAKLIGAGINTAVSAKRAGGVARLQFYAPCHHPAQNSKSAS